MTYVLIALAILIGIPVLALVVFFVWLMIDYAIGNNPFL